MTGDDYEVQGFIEVLGGEGDPTTSGRAGWIHFSFRGPALTVQLFESVYGVGPAATGLVDIGFPCRFTERPVFHQSYEHAANQSSVAGLIPATADIMSWRQGRRSETGLIFYDGVRLLVRAASVVQP